MNKNLLAEIINMELKLSTMLNNLLKQRGLTLKELALATKIKASTLSGWKNGVSPRDLTEVHRCAQYLGVSLEKFLFDENSEISALENLITEQVFDGFLKVKIERVVNKKK